MGRRRKKNSGENLATAIILLGVLITYNSGLKSALPLIMVLLFIGGFSFVLLKKEKSARAKNQSRPDLPKRKSVRCGDSEETRNDAINDLLAGDDWDISAPESIPEEWSLPLLMSLEWKRFETICCEYLRFIGYEPQETRIGADGGVDIWVYKPGQEKPVGIVQCKAWSTYKVGVKPVRELFGVMAAEGVPNGKFITSGEFTGEAEEFAEGKRLQLITGTQFLDSILKLPEENQSQLLEFALEGDYKTPTCPQCGVKMKLRESSKSRKKFWGCSGFPYCRSTLVYKDKAA